jgi:bifunctional non-homologous end joining protein LigD
VRTGAQPSDCSNDPAVSPKLVFTGKVHEGLNPANRRALLKLLQPLAAKKCPFANLPTVAGRKAHWGEGVTAEEMADYTWLRPEIEAEIKFAEWTTASVLRHAEFVALSHSHEERA